MFINLLHIKIREGKSEKKKAKKNRNAYHLEMRVDWLKQISNETMAKFENKTMKRDDNGDNNRNWWPKCKTANIQHTHTARTANGKREKEWDWKRNSYEINCNIKVKAYIYKLYWIGGNNLRVTRSRASTHTHTHMTIYRYMLVKCSK